MHRLRALPLLTLLSLAPLLLRGQSPLAVAPPAQTQAQLRAALAGQWVGLLEYRDYSEPATSTRRTQLPTWLTIAAQPDGSLTQHFVYDDGPGKVVTEDLRLRLDPAAGTWTITNDKNRTEVYKVTGYGALLDGRGGLTITGPTIDNGRPAETLITLTVRRNLLTWTESNRAVATQPYVFRHSYTFVRAQSPAPLAAQPR